MQYLTVSPAYGRDYKSANAAKADWFAGKDFIMQSVSTHRSGTYCSIRDFAEGTTINIRYNKMRRVVPVECKSVPADVDAWSNIE
jgi:hypothetical protein